MRGYNGQVLPITLKQLFVLEPLHPGNSEELIF